MSENTFIAPLSHLGLIAVEGDDASSFLHNQLTNDVLGLNASTARLAGYCSPKGRLLATLQVWQAENRLLLLLPLEILPAIQKRLQMFVMRSKVKLADVSDSYGLIGLVNPAASLLAQHYPELPSDAYTMSSSAAGTLIRQPDAAGMTRYLWISSTEQAQAILASAAPAAASLWRWSEIQAGIPQITLATQEQFVPQMINFEIVGGVNFRKGCYPGQEIVARSQYLGKFKRRMLLARVDAAEAAAGTEVYAESDPGQPCGMLVNAERGPDGTLACLVEMKLDVVGQPVHLGAADGPLLAFSALPYSLPAPA
jgi:folate-binding protein YgfZ